MKLTRIIDNETELINFPIKRWGKYSNPTLDFMKNQGFTEIVPEPPIPQTDEELLLLKRQFMIVSSFQFKKALTRSGTKRSEVESLVVNPDTGYIEMDQDIKDGWADAGTIKRLDPLALYVQWILEWSDEEADALFELAAIL